MVNMTCGPLELLRLLVYHRWDEIIDEVLENTIPLLKKYNLQILGSHRRPCSCRNASSGCVPFSTGVFEIKKTG